MRALDILGALPFILPELTELKGVEQPPPHIADVWQHTLDVLNKLHRILDVLNLQYNPDKAANINMGLVAIRLGRYRQQLSKHLDISLNVDRPIRPLLFLAALYHDISKPQTRKVDDQGRIRFLGHDQMGAEIITNRARLLKLSNPEINRLYVIVRHHLRPSLLGNLERAPSRRAIYRFFRDTGEAGVDICLLSLADVLATYGTTLPQNVWNKHLDIIRILLEAWWEHPEERVSPPIVLNGDDLITRFNLAPGPRIGQLLEAVREAQVTGQIKSREEAFLFVKKYLTQKDESGS
jgi:putative nucleotidyltransferase with HDIG domain